jgi:thiamine pyrophosphokinase
MTSSINNSNNSNLNEIRITNEEIFNEKPMNIFNTKDYSFLILNGNYDSNNEDAMVRDNFNIFWSQSMYRVAVDGGLNILNELDKGSPSLYIPHTLIGDLDSADSDLIKEYDKCGVEIIKQDDQNSTDLTKALNLVVDRIDQGHLPRDKPIIIYGSSQLDRADHYFGQIHTLLHFAEICPKIKIYFCQNLSLSRILIKGHHRLDLSTGYEGKIIGLFPIGEPAQVITNGLKWNINGKMKFGQFVSSSNELVSPVVDITTSSPLLLTLTIDRPQKEGCCGGGCG